MNLSRSMRFVAVFSVLLGLSSSLVETAVCALELTDESAPAAPLNEETEESVEFDLELDDDVLCDGPDLEAKFRLCRGEVLSERRVLLASHGAASDIAPRAPPAC